VVLVVAGRLVVQLALVARVRGAAVVAAVAVAVAHPAVQEPQAVPEVLVSSIFVVGNK
jgi:hypothetical protein